jgi:hypothetical protein
MTQIRARVVANGSTQPSPAERIAGLARTVRRHQRSLQRNGPTPIFSRDTASSAKRCATGLRSWTPLVVKAPTEADR